MTASRFAVVTGAGILGAMAVFAACTPTFAGSIGVGGFGHTSSVSIGGPVAPTFEPRYNLGPGNAVETNADSCMQTCLNTTAGPVRRVQHSCRRTCASNAF